MEETSESKTNYSHSISDRSLTEINYHRRLDTRLVIFALPIFLFFSFFYFFRDNFLQAFIFSGLSINAALALLMSYRIKELKHLVLLNQIGATIVFGLLAVSLAAGLLSDDLYIFFPWIYLYPVVVMLSFGERIGLYCSLTFCLVATVIVWAIDLPSWDDWSTTMFKLNSAFSLISIVIIVLISEKTRVRMRNKLLDARNRYKLAEEQQRNTNQELKSEIELRSQSEKALTQSEARYRALFEESTVSLWEEDWSRVKAYLEALPQEMAEDLTVYFKKNPKEIESCVRLMQVTAVNRATLSLYGADTSETLKKNIRKVLPPSSSNYMKERLISLYLSGRYNAESTGQTLNGRPLHLLVSSTIPAGYEESWEKVYTSVYDVTEKVAVEQEKKRVDQQLQHARQIQAIASLAGGIAHQFNNALAVICGSLDLIELDVQGGADNTRFIGSLRTSADRLRRLTEQLLAYAQGGKYQPKDFSANDLIEQLLKSNKILRNSSIQVSTNFQPDLTMTGGDLTQIRSALAAVLANALESVSDGGEITITTRNQTIAEDGILSNDTLPPGRYAAIVIEDNGIGMDEQTRQRIFEPFFTTKFAGRGLGMAAAYGIIRNHDGMIAVESEPNIGTRVLICLPSVDRPASNQSGRAA